LELTVLPAYLPKQRWFAGKTRQIQEIRVSDWVPIDSASILFLHVAYKSGEPEEYVAPFVTQSGDVQDALLSDAFCAALLSAEELPTSGGGTLRIRLVPEAREATALPIERGSAEQMNSSVIYGANV